MIIFIRNYFSAKKNDSVVASCCRVFVLVMSEKRFGGMRTGHSVASSMFPALFCMQASGRFPPASRIPTFMFCAFPIRVFT